MAQQQQRPRYADDYLPEPFDDGDDEQQQNRGQWFAGLRSRINAAFSMSDWLTQLGITASSSSNGTRAKSVDPSTSSSVRTSPSRDAPSLRDKIQHNPAAYDFSNVTPTRLPSQSRSRSVDPMECQEFSVMYDSSTLTPIDSPVGDKKFAQQHNGNNEHNSDEENEDGNGGDAFWLRLEPGRQYKDTLQLQHFGPLADLLPVGKVDEGRGHDFQTLRLVNPTWCDKCGDFMIGFVKQALRCSFCNYTCHYKCRPLVTLDCRSLNDSLSDGTYKTATSDMFLQMQNFGLNDDDDATTENDQDTVLTDCLATDDSASVVVKDEVIGALDEPEVGQGILLAKCVFDYNQQTPSGLGITLDEDGISYSGYIQIHMNFTRPINVVAGQRPPSVYDVVGNGTATATDGRRTITSFYLPRNTIKTLHIDSETCTREMVVTLLRKFKVADNPRKFALYERRVTHNEGSTTQVKLYRISDDAFPLRLALHWGPATNKRFVLQENETGDILWEAFEVPELNNFLKILELEEAQYVWQTRQRFNLFKHKLVTELRQRGWAIDDIQNAQKHGRLDPFSDGGTDGMLNGLMDNADEDPFASADGSMVISDEQQLAYGRQQAEHDAALRQTELRAGSEPTGSNTSGSGQQQTSSANSSTVKPTKTWHMARLPLDQTL